MVSIPLFASFIYTAPTTIAAKMSNNDTTNPDIPSFVVLTNHFSDYLALFPPLLLNLNFFNFHNHFSFYLNIDIPFTVSIIIGVTATIAAITPVATIAILTLIRQSKYLSIFSSNYLHFSFRKFNSCTYIIAPLYFQVIYSQNYSILNISTLQKTILTQPLHYLF